MSGGLKFGKRGRRVAIGAALLAGSTLAGLASPAWAQSAEAAAQRSFNIPSQPLADAIMDYGAQSGVQVTAGADLVARRTSSAVSGSFSPAEALSRMLTGTGLTFRFIRANVVTLEPAPQVAGGDGAITLGPVRVEGDDGSNRGYSLGEPTADSPMRGFVARRSTAGTRSDIPLIETPQSITVVTRDQMEAQAVESLAHTFAYSAGITALDGGADQRSVVGFVMRGFNITGSAPLLLNGSRFPINSYNAPPDPYSYERVELLKGPASILYGNATPGGIINLVSKRPTAEPVREVVAQVGSWDRVQLAADFGGPLTMDGKIGYRLTSLWRDGRTMVSEVPDDRLLLNAAFDWRPSASVALTLLGTYNRSHTTTGSYASPQSGSVTPNPFGKVPRDLFTGEPDFDKFKTKGLTLGYIFEWKISDSWKFKQNFLYFDYEVDNAYSNIRARTTITDPAPGDRLARGAATRFDTNDGITFDNQLQGKIAHGMFEHTLVFGLDWNKQEFNRVQRSGSQLPLDLLNPVYGVSNITLNNPTNLNSNSEWVGLYLQDHIKISSQFIVLFGGRFDKIKDDEVFTAVSGEVDLTKVKSDAFSPRVGVMYLHESGFAPYYSFTKSFQPVQGIDFLGRSFKPTRGRQHEAGIKFEPSGANLSVTVAAYEITQTNVLTTDLDNPDFSIQVGEVRSRGFELEARASWDSGLDLVGAFSHTDARITKSNTGTQGNRPNSVPRYTASLWADYKLPFLSGLSTALGVRHIGRAADVSGLEIVKPFTLFDAALRYETGNWRFALNAKNLFNKDYVSACTFQCWNGEERNVTLTARYKW